MAHQLYAKIKPSSKYFSHNFVALVEGQLPFPVEIVPRWDDFWVRGGPGKKYRLEDVELFIIVDECELEFENIKVSKRN